MPTKTLVHGSDGNYYVIDKNEITMTLNAQQKHHVETVTLKNAQDDLTNYLNLPSGVKVRITEAF
jgi:hypothetical protein